MGGGEENMEQIRFWKWENKLRRFYRKKLKMKAQTENIKNESHLPLEHSTLL